MPTSKQSTSPPPRRRRALQERSSAHTNERSPTRSIQSLRMVFGEKEDADMYTATPFPTKPEQILLPIPGKGQQGYISDTGFSYAGTPGPSTSTRSSPAFSHPAASSTRDLSVHEAWDVSSTVDTLNSPPQMWDDPVSSKSSLPEISPAVKHEDYTSDGPDEPEYSDDEMIVLPTATPTIKAVISEPPTSPKTARDEESIIGYSSPNIEQIAPSSPNFETIGAPSSPNFVTLDNSSINFFPSGAANSDSEPRSNSLSSWNSRGTAVRHAGVTAPWIHTAGSSEQLSTRSPSSFHSSPPLRSVASFRSNPRRPSASRSRSPGSSSRSFRSVSEMAAAIDSGIPIQYPRIRAPSSSSRADTSVSSDRDFTPVRDRDFTPGPASGRWNPHLSRVSSVWSDEDLANLAAVGHPESTPAREMSEPAIPETSLISQTSNSSVWLGTDTDEDERQDSLTNLPPRPGFPGSLSSGSKRSNSTRSLKRPGTSSSTVWHILPTWAKIYYRADALGINSAFSIMDVSRPSSARPGTSNSSVFNFNLMPTPLNIPRGPSPERPRSSQRPASPPRPSSPQQAPAPVTAIAPAQPALPQRPGPVRFVQRRIESDPLDPRAHWVPDPDEEGEVVGTPRHRGRHSWSPHLYTDRRGIPHSSSAWTAPSLDSTNEPVFGRRNIQVYSFCVGFIFPLAWIIASFLPLPPLPKLSPEMANVGDDVEMALETQLIALQRRRHENARWWRNLNRWMISLGVVIIVIIIALAVIGTTTGF